MNPLLVEIVVAAYTIAADLDGEIIIKKYFEKEKNEFGLKHLHIPHFDHHQNH